MTLAGVAVVLRFVSRYLCKAAVKADDYMIIAALVFAAGEVTGGLLCTSSLAYYPRCRPIAYTSHLANRCPARWWKACDFDKGASDIWRGKIPELIFSESLLKCIPLL